MTQTDFEAQYQEGDLPWDHGMVDGNLPRMVERFGINPCKAIDIGCGTGDNARWMAEQGFQATGCDLSKTAIEMASAKEGAEACTFLVADLLKNDVPEQSFGFAFDRGCFHSIHGEGERQDFVAMIAGLLETEGWWLSLVGNADEPRREVGPPQMTATELIGFVEPHFEIVSLETGHFVSDQKEPPRAWICLMRKRC